MLAAGCAGACLWLGLSVREVVGRDGQVVRGSHRLSIDQWANPTRPSLGGLVAVAEVSIVDRPLGSPWIDSRPAPKSRIGARLGLEDRDRRKRAEARSVVGDACRQHRACNRLESHSIRSIGSHARNPCPTPLPAPSSNVPDRFICPALRSIDSSNQTKSTHHPTGLIAQSCLPRGPEAPPPPLPQR